ncbi:MAG: benzoate-CoA ligase family protein [Deltaproteobacteria bacterium]|nr:benzoate-CoA ligase family protein [Deltaproteobacteria bacterium]
MQNHTFTVDSVGSTSRLVFAPCFNVAGHFIDRHLGEGRGGKAAIRTDEGENVTYAELAGRVNRAGQALLGLGLTPGDRVLLMIKDSPEFFYVFWGAVKAGLVPVPINTILRAKDYKFMLEDSGCGAVVYSPEYAGEVETALAQATQGPRFAIRTQGQGRDFATLMAEASDELDLHPTKATDECFWLYSSGSTGAPKGTVHCHQDMVFTSHYFAQGVLGVGPDDVFFSAAKLFFAYGLGNGMYFPLWCGGTAVLSAARPTPDSTFAVIEKLRPTLYFGVPTLYAAQLAALEKAPRDTSAVRACVSAGEALPADILRRWREHTGRDILDGIGSTEVLHIFICNRPGDVMPGSSGKLVEGYEARIVDREGSELPVGEAGRLLIRGGSTAKYYWNNPAKTAGTMLAEGWLDTGDTYYKDAGDFYYYCGRNDDMLKVGGIWCSPFEIEAKIIEHPQVLEAAVVGQNDENGLVKPAAYIVLKNAQEACENLRDDLLKLCKGGLAPYKYPRWINFVPELPKTATGKIQRFQLRRAEAQPQLG